MNCRRISQFLLAFFLLLCSSSRTISAQTAASAPPTVVFMTDFGVVDDSVALCKGVMYSIAPELRIVDLTHEVTPFSILDGARFLYGASPYFPVGTVFVTVIDPGVGSTRKAIIAHSRRGRTEHDRSVPRYQSWPEWRHRPSGEFTFTTTAMPKK